MAKEFVSTVVALAMSASGCSDASQGSTDRGLAGAASSAGAASAAGGIAAIPAAGNAGMAGRESQGGAASGAGGVELGGAGTAGSEGGASGSTPIMAGTSGAAGSVTGTPLFNGTDLSGFAAFREPQTALSAEQAATIFKVEDGAIRVYGDAPDKSTQARHTLVTLRQYSKYRLSLEYQWGTKVFAPYTDLARYPRDAGVLFHLHGDTQEVWPPSIEFQIKDGTTGDIFALYARCTSLASNGGKIFVPAENGGSEKLVDGSDGFVQHGRSENFELPGWNQLLLEVRGGSATFSVNGHVVNQVLSIMDRTGKPVMSGPIALQAEHAEIFYRNIVLEELP
jgi:hypothetical protein